MLGREQDSEIIQIRTRDSVGQTPPPGGAAPWHLFGETRRRQGLSMEEVAARARVSPFVVEAIETGAIERLPVGNGGRRETIAVCRTLDIDPKPFVADLRQRRPALAGQLDSPKQVGRRTRFLIIGMAWILLGAVLVTGRAVGWIDSDSEPAPAPTTAAREAESGQTEAVPTTAAAPQTGAYRVDVKATLGGTPLVATVDGTVVYDEILAQDDKERFEGEDIRLQIVQPTMVRVSVNGKAVASRSEMVFSGPPEAATPESGTAPAPVAPVDPGAAEGP
jgi:hypothetical protein